MALVQQLYKTVDQLTPTQSAYGNIERGMIAIVFGCRRFHQFVYGRKLIVHSTHRPLAATMNKNRSAASARLQRILLKLVIKILF